MLHEVRPSYWRAWQHKRHAGMCTIFVSQTVYEIDNAVICYIAENQLKKWPTPTHLIIIIRSSSSDD